MNKALRIWADDNPYNTGRASKGLGRTTGLANHLGLTQPAVTKMINGDIDIKSKYVKKIVEYTGIPIKDLLPEYHELFKDCFELELVLLDGKIKEKKDFIKNEIGKTIAILENLNID